MRLAVTGAAARAARHARLVPRLNHSVRRNSSQAGEQVSRNTAVGQSQQDEAPEWTPFAVNKPPQHPSSQTETGLPPRSFTYSATPRVAKTYERKKANALAAGRGSAKPVDLAPNQLEGQPPFNGPESNVPPSISNLVNRRLYDSPNHPICITRKLIESAFPYPQFRNYTASNPIVTTYSNFDVLGFPADHPGRARSDTYYLDEKHVLRTHTSAHQHAAFQMMTHQPEPGYTICADVYRRDSIDRSHFPVFHQMEGAMLWSDETTHPNDLRKSRFASHTQRRDQIIADNERLPRGLLHREEDCRAIDYKTNPAQPSHSQEDVRLMCLSLKLNLEVLVSKVFEAARSADVSITPSTPTELPRVRWVEAYFPFTSPSYELEVLWNGEWLELLGCGIVKQAVLDNAGLNDRIGWAWGIGVERLAMLLFGIPDIRLFWSEDRRFLDQFKEGRINKFEPFSKFPACYKDIAFWVPPQTNTNTTAAAAATQFHENDVMEIVRDVAASLAEDVTLVDEFVHPTSGRRSVCYRINYRSLERTLTNDEVNAMHSEVGSRLTRELGVELR